MFCHLGMLLEEEVKDLDHLFAKEHDDHRV